MIGKYIIEEDNREYVYEIMDKIDSSKSITQFSGGVAIGILRYNSYVLRRTLDHTFKVINCNDIKYYFITRRPD